MLNALMAMIAGIAKMAEEEGGSPGTGTLIIDLMNLQWWQGVSALIVALGLSPAPWILGLAMNRLGFTKAMDAAHQRELDAREKAYTEQIEQRDLYHSKIVEGLDERYAALEVTNQRHIEIADQQKQRGDRLEDALAKSTKVIGETNHILLELKGAAEEVTPDGS